MIDLSEDYGAKYYEVSAKAGVNIEEIFEDMYNSIDRVRS